MAKAAKKSRAPKPSAAAEHDDSAGTEQTDPSASASSDDASDRLPPLPLVFVVLVCSGMLWTFSFRDVFATGRVIAGSSDAAMQIFTKSTKFFDDSKGWKSTQGGLSAIAPVTTDLNDMGGFFVRKVGGAASLAVHTQKLLPMLFHTKEARWDSGHFKPTLWLSFIANLAVCCFYGMYMPDLAVATADGLPKLFIGTLLIESAVILGYLMTNRVTARGPAVKMPLGKTPKSIPSRIVARTVAIVSTFMAVTAARDLFLPGQIIDIIPRDDIYLEWTGAFFYSPPDGTVEAEKYSMVADLHIGEKFLGQFMGLHVLLLCGFKIFSAFGIRYGSDGSGLVKSAMIWRAQAVGGALILLLYRLFSPSALSASLDLRWHLMSIAYETFILGLYGYF